MNPRLAAVVAALALSACAAFGLVAPGEAGSVVISASPIPLYPDDPGRKDAGELIYRGGLVLKSDDARFGGLSGLRVGADGQTLLAVSDVAFWFRAELGYDVNGDLARLDHAEIAPMLGADGKPMRGKDGDAEGLEFASDRGASGPVLVSFERAQRVWLYDLGQGHAVLPEPVPMGAWIDDLNSNEGLEAIVLVRGDTLLAISENTRDANGDIQGALEAFPAYVGRGGYGRLSVIPHEPFRVTDAARAPSGGVFLLERRYSPLGGVGMALRHIAEGEIHPGARIEGKTLVLLSGTEANIDNMEGLAARAGPNGETLLYMISDDNFQPGLQRTVLLMFALRDSAQ